MGRVFFGDITDPASLDRIFTAPQGSEVFVIHCAAIVYIKSKFSQKVWDVNLNGTLNVAEKSLAAGAKMIYVNSVHSIPELPHDEVMTEVDDYNPDLVRGEYAKTKAEGTRRVLQMVHDRGLDCCIVQPAGIIGPATTGARVPSVTLPIWVARLGITLLQPVLPPQEAHAALHKLRPRHAEGELSL